MQELEDIALLREYVERDSEEAFAALVTRHVNKVYSVALRHAGQPHQAEEITQAVFVMLARKSRHLGKRVLLSGWLYHAARLTAWTFVRSEIRRTRREQEAHMQIVSNDKESEVWTQIAPWLDEAMAGLNETDRHAVVMRFFDGKSMKDIGSALGANEDAAKKRVGRAVEKLRLFFLKHGITSTSAAIVGAISAHAVEAAPAALAGRATAFALAHAGAAGGSTLPLIKGALKFMAWSNAKTGLVAALVAASVVFPLLVQQQAQAKLRVGDEALRQQAAEWSRLQKENDRLASANANASLDKNQLGDLQKLRGEVAALRQQTMEVSRLKEENRQLKAKIGLDKPKSPLQVNAERMVKVSFAKNWLVAFYIYADQHGGQFPTNFEQAAPFVGDTIKNQEDVTTNQFEIVYQGSPSALSNAPNVIVFREAQAWETPATEDRKGQWAKMYGFADGHVEIRVQPENNFDDYEQQHTVAPPDNAP